MTRVALRIPENARSVAQLLPISFCSYLLRNDVVHVLHQYF